MALGPAHGEEGISLKFKHMSSHEVQDMFPHLMDLPAVPLPLRESVQQIEVLMVSIYG